MKPEHETIRTGSVMPFNFTAVICIFPIRVLFGRYHCKVHFSFWTYIISVQHKKSECSCNIACSNSSNASIRIGSLMILIHRKIKLFFIHLQGSAIEGSEHPVFTRDDKR